MKNINFRRTRMGKKKGRSARSKTIGPLGRHTLKGRRRTLRGGMTPSGGMTPPTTLIYDKNREHERFNSNNIIEKIRQLSILDPLSLIKVRRLMINGVIEYDRIWVYHNGMEEYFELYSDSILTIKKIEPGDVDDRTEIVGMTLYGPRRTSWPEEIR